jgi:hypothetical protein
MKKPLLVVTHDQHLAHLMRMVPLIFGIFVFQCLLMRSIIENAELGNWFIFMALVICTMISFFYYYDTQHRVELYENAICVSYPPFMAKKVIPYGKIKKIFALDQELEFTNIRIDLNSGKALNLYFVDTPEKVVKMIEQRMLVPINQEYQKSA